MSNIETKKEKNGILNKIGGDKLILIVAIIVVFALFTFLNKNFLTWANMVNLMVAASLVGLVAVGHTYLIIAGQNDLSPGSLAAFCGTLAALLLSKNVPFILTVAVVLLAGIATGFFNAWMVNKIKLEAFIATLVTQNIMRGFAYIICDGKPISISNKTYLAIGKARFLTIPVSVWLMILAFVIFGFILSKTKFGRNVYAIGGNVEAAKLAGVSVNKITISLYGISAFLASIAGIVLTGRISSGAPASGTGTEMDVVTAVVIGGISVNGGKGSMLGAFLGAVIIGVLSNGLTIMNIGEYYQQVVKGLVLILAVAFDVLANKEKVKKVKEA